MSPGAPRWALLCGESGTETSGCARRVIARLRGEGVRVAGYLQQKLRDEEGRKRYEVERLEGGERRVLAVDGVAPRGPREDFFCSMSIHLDAFAAARAWVEEDATGAGVLVLDGISKLEVSGQGHCATLEDALRRGGEGLVLLCARASQLSAVVERFGLEEPGLAAALELPAGEPEEERFAAELLEALGPGRRG